MKPALLVIDIQKAYFMMSPEAVDSLNSSIKYINAAIELFRKENLPVINILHMAEEYDLIPGKDGFDSPDELKVLPTDLHIHKNYGNSFNRTDLAEKLREMDVDTVIVTGYSAEYCVLSTYRAAQDNDIVPIMLRGSLASSSPENIGFVENISDIISYGALKKLLC